MTGSDSRYALRLLAAAAVDSVYGERSDDLADWESQHAGLFDSDNVSELPGLFLTAFSGDDVPGIGPSESWVWWTGRVMSAMAQHNQFVWISDDQARTLNQRVRHAAAKSFGTATTSSSGDANPATDREKYRTFLRSIYAMTNQWLATLTKEPAAKITSGEYDAALQLSALGIKSLHDLGRGTVLDLCCGEEARLVQYLRQEGIEAYGLDRLADAPYAAASDVLETEFDPEAFGTVVSHFGFSLHFLVAHYASPDAVAIAKPEAYARAYMRILEALEPGGSFVYTPAVIDFEKVLPKSRFKVERTKVPFAAHVLAEKPAAGISLTPELKDAFGTAVRVTRIAN